jgi:hypothetical protein
MTTGHGESPQTVLTRLAGAALRLPTARGLVQVVDLYVRVGIDLVVFLDIHEGPRVVTSVDEVDWEAGAEVTPFVYPLRNAWRYAGAGCWEAGPALREHTAKVRAKLPRYGRRPRSARRYQLRSLAGRMREAHHSAVPVPTPWPLEGVQSSYPSGAVLRWDGCWRSPGGPAEARRGRKRNQWRAVLAISTRRKQQLTRWGSFVT